MNSTEFLSHLVPFYNSRCKKNQFSLISSNSCLENEFAIQFILFEYNLNDNTPSLHLNWFDFRDIIEKFMTFGPDF